MRTIEHWIGGTTDRRAPRPARAPVWNPATGEQQAEVLLAERERRRRRRARGAARRSSEWSQSSLSQRTKVLFAFRELVNAHVGRARRG